MTGCGRSRWTIPSRRAWVRSFPPREPSVYRSTGNQPTTLREGPRPPAYSNTSFSSPAPPHHDTHRKDHQGHDCDTYQQSIHLGGSEIQVLRLGWLGSDGNQVLFGGEPIDHVHKQIAVTLKPKELVGRH